MPSQLKELIIGKIASEGPITFKEFMELALYHPQWGYYSSSASRIGKEGDFFTSASVGDLFGKMLARQIAEMVEVLGGRPTIVEMGAGQGYLAKDVILELERLGCSSTYCIVERSPAMKAKQQEMLKDLTHVGWIDGLSGIAPFCGVLFSNELVDSFPVHLVEMCEDGLKEVYISFENGEFVETLQEPSTKDLEKYFKELGVTLSVGFRTEVNLEAVRWIELVGDSLERGFVITIDYGYPSHELYQPYRSRGTLMAYKGHRTSEDVVAHPGEQDITSHVNFSALKHWGEKVGLKTLGFTDQSHFLLSLGLLDLLNEGDGLEMSQVLKAKTLIMPGGMGDTFKVLIQGKGVDEGWFPLGLREVPKRGSFRL